LAVKSFSRDLAAQNLAHH